MAEFTIRIAGRAVQVRSLFESTRDYCRAYLTSETPEFSVTVTREELESEQRFLEAEALEEGLRIRKFSDPFLERSVIQRKVAEHLLNFGVLLFHGSTVAVDGEAYLFTAAKCGTGKSTHTRLWRKVFGARAVMVNDDKPFLQITETGILAHGSPWSGKHGLDTNITAPLKGICILRRGTENRIWRVPGEEVHAMLRHQGCCPEDPGKHPAYERLVDALMGKTPLWQMECTKDPQAAVIAYEAMSQS